MDPASKLEPIPRPPGHLLIGNLLDLNASHPIESLMELTRQYGPIYELAIPGRGSRIVVSSYELVSELCDESRFDKVVGPGLKALAEGPAGAGLFSDAGGKTQAVRRRTSDVSVGWGGRHYAER